MIKTQVIMSFDKKSKSMIRKKFRETFGHSNLTKIKKHLKEIAEYQYGCYFSEVDCGGVRVFYTSNPNHFCRYGIKVGKVGMCNVEALTVKDWTKEGKKRVIGLSNLKSAF